MKWVLTSLLALMVAACAPAEVAPPTYVLQDRIPVTYVWDSTIPGEAQARWSIRKPPTIAIHPTKFLRQPPAVQHFIILHELAHLDFVLRGVGQSELAADCQAVVWMREKSMMSSSGLAEVIWFLQNLGPSDVHPPGVERANNALSCLLEN